MLNEAPELPTWRLVPPPLRARRVANALLFCFSAGLLFVLVAPWQQSVPGSGRVVAYAPLDRQQVIEAPIKGRVAQWWVQEGSQVKAGDPIARLEDNDPEYMIRLEAERDALLRQLTAYQDQVNALRQRVTSTQDARDQKIESARAKLRGAETKVRQALQKLEANEAKLETQLQQLARVRALFGEGLSSQRDLELALLYDAQARTERDAARQEVELQRQMVEGARADLAEATSDGDAKVDKARSELSKAESELADGEAKRNKLDTGIARQEAQLITAPRAGTILRLLAAQQTEQVKEGDPIAILVPDAADRAVELWVDGNDAALISPGRHVRLQFEGWPAVQFTGWPSVATGTFGGEVALVDAAGAEGGQFRVLVRPAADDRPWPDPRYLRQGVRANGWVMLDEVTVAFEMWRQLNGFPPAIDPPDADKGSKDKKKEEK
jgi:adhesin transport system membrane fusion protein